MAVERASDPLTQQARERKVRRLPPERIQMLMIRDHGRVSQGVLHIVRDHAIGRGDLDRPPPAVALCSRHAGAVAGADAGGGARGARGERGGERPPDAELHQGRRPDDPAARLGRGRLHGREHPHRAVLQYLRTQDASGRRTRHFQFHRAGLARRADYHLRRGQADALLLLRRRPGRGLRAPDGHARRGDRADEPRQSRRIHHPRAGGEGHRPHRLEVEDGAQAAARGRPDAAQARHLACAPEAALGAAHLAGLGVGCYRGLDDLATAWREDRRFEPGMSRERAAELMAGWESAVARL